MKIQDLHRIIKYKNQYLIENNKDYCTPDELAEKLGMKGKDVRDLLRQDAGLFDAQQDGSNRWKIYKSANCQKPQVNFTTQSERHSDSEQRISNNTANNVIQSSDIDSPRYDFNTKPKANKQKILKQEILKKICTKHFSTHTHERLSLDKLKASSYYDEIVNVYHRLGGILTTIPAGVGRYDIDTPNFIIELDEENHFNRYRLSTLQSDVYNDNHNLDVELYKGYCKSYENKCRTYGKYVSSDSTNKQFGKSVVDGDLKDVNRTRWKQRAFYDYIKDITSLVIGVPIIRISIYEVYKGKTIETLIKNHCEDLLIEYINMRLEKCK